MRWMVKLYDQALEWSRHKHAPGYLAAVSFVDSSVFPIPPFFMLAPMALARPNKAITYAWIATFASVFGGLLGYLLGYLIFKPVMLPLLEYFGYMGAYNNVITVFKQHGFIALLILGMSPIPYKIVAIGSGFLQVPVHLFFATSLLSRGLKFFAVALVIKLGGANMEQYMRTLLQKLGAVILGIVGLVLFICFKVIYA
ncbi:MAG TPA: VTT domain-containing protein [Gammaproteobacteria bacterium]|nr:VTT domain-containing protein [Gammaproteobacteria bacterium]